MKTFLANSVTRVALVVAIVCIPALRASAQDLPEAKPLDDMKALAAKPTPKTPDGHPDLNGRWLAPRLTRGVRGSYGKVVGNEHQLIFGIPATGDPETDAAVTEKLNDIKHQTAKKREANAPQYKPEFVDKVKMMAIDVNHYDPTTYSCRPPGVPRMGAPSLITEMPGQMILLYGARPYSTFRVIPMNKPHRKVDDDFDPNPMGDSVGHWEGDTLVIDTIGFDDTTWFGAAGWFHSDAMHVIERFTRKGDTLEYSVTVEDPDVLLQPYNLTPTPEVFKIGGPDDVLRNEDLPCDIEGNHDFRQHADHEHNIVN
jgi:hypothetical protein